MDEKYYRDFLFEAIKKCGSLTRKQIDQLLWKKLPEVLSDEQKIYKITNILAWLRKRKKIKCEGWAKNVCWKPTDHEEESVNES